MKSLASSERRALRARAHTLSPVVMIGNAGLTPSVLHEIDVNLMAHELIKVRVFSDERAARETMLSRICDELDASPVQHIGKLLVLFRKRPAEVAEARPEPVKPVARPRGPRALHQEKLVQARRRARPVEAAAATPPQPRRKPRA